MMTEVDWSLVPSAEGHERWQRTGRARVTRHHTSHHIAPSYQTLHAGARLTLTLTQNFLVCQKFYRWLHSSKTCSGSNVQSAVPHKSAWCNWLSSSPRHDFLSPVAGPVVWTVESIITFVYLRWCCCYVGTGTAWWLVVKLCWHSTQSQSVWQTKYKICITKITEWQGRPLRLPWGQLLTREQWRTCLYADQCGLCLSTCSPELRVSPVIFSPHSSRLFISGHHNNQQGQLASQSQAFSAPSSTFRTLILAENRPGKHRHDRNEMLWHFESDLGSSAQTIRKILLPPPTEI